jgi:hypothetical protein
LPEAYALALFALARPPDRSLDPADLAGPVARAIHAQLVDLGQVADAAMLAGLLDGAEPTLRRGLEQVRIWVERLADRPARDLQRELEVAALKLRQERLRHEHRQVLDLIDDRSGSDRSGSHQAGNDQAASSADERSELLRMLSDIAEQLKGTEAELATRGGVGSLVWRTRQANEIASG